MNEANDISTQMDDTSNAGPSEQDLLDAVMSNSPIMEDAGVPLPKEGVIDEDPGESDYAEDPDESDEVVSEDDEEEVEEVDEEGLDEDAPEGATQEADTYTVDDLDLDAKLSVKIDGEDLEVSFGDLVKGYTTEQSLSKKGRELGEARKELEAEREAKLSEIENIAGASVQMLSNAENAYAKQYHDFEGKIKKAREDGDTYELNELKDKREQSQQRYWQARQQREKLVEGVSAQRQQLQEQQFQEQINHFQETIPDHIPDFDEKVANDIREFAIEKGIAEGLLDSVVDPAIVKFIDDYRRLEQGVSKGKAKRKAAPTKKALPTKKAKPAATKKANADKMTKARAMKEGASQDDQMAFLRNYASKSLGNI